MNLIERLVWWWVELDLIRFSVSANSILKHIAFICSPVNETSDLDRQTERMRALRKTVFKLKLNWKYEQQRSSTSRLHYLSLDVSIYVRFVRTKTNHKTLTHEITTTINPSAEPQKIEFSLMVFGWLQSPNWNNEKTKIAANIELYSIHNLCISLSEFRCVWVHMRASEQVWERGSEWVCCEWMSGAPHTQNHQHSVNGKLSYINESEATIYKIIVTLSHY